MQQSPPIDFGTLVDFGVWKRGINSRVSTQWIIVIICNWLCAFRSALLLIILNHVLLSCNLIKKNVSSIGVYFKMKCVSIAICVLFLMGMAVLCLAAPTNFFDDIPSAAKVCDSLGNPTARANCYVIIYDSLYLNQKNWPKINILKKHKYIFRTISGKWWMICIKQTWLLQEILDKDYRSNWISLFLFDIQFNNQIETSFDVYSFRYIQLINCKVM